MGKTVKIYFYLIILIYNFVFRAVDGHLDNPSGKNWVDWDSILLEDFKEMVGAKNITENAINSTLTTNLHNLMIYFYNPTKDRHKIITDSMSFPSDYVIS